jgi:acetoin:2,6-dichlorophenolindophenol oxidoreductase subunit beta
MTREIPFGQAVNEALREEMARDEQVVVLGIDVRVSPFGTTAGLAQQFDQRVINTPISEAAIVGTALGMAMSGLRPVAEIMFADFMYLAMDELANQVSSWRYMTGGQVGVPLTVRTVSGAGWCMGYNHSQSTEAGFMQVPGLKIAVPSNPYDAKGLLKTAIRDDDPVLFFEQKMLLGMTGEVPEEDYTVPFGQARVARPGKDATVVALSHMVNKALAAAEQLAAEGIEVEVIDPRTLSPFDLPAVLRSVAKTSRLVIAEEGRRQGGAGAEIAAQVVEQGFELLDAPIARVGAPHVPIPCSPALEQAYLPSEADIVQAVRGVLAGLGSAAGR